MAGRNASDKRKTRRVAARAAFALLALFVLLSAGIVYIRYRMDARRRCELCFAGNTLAICLNEEDAGAIIRCAQDEYEMITGKSVSLREAVACRTVYTGAAPTEKETAVSALLDHAGATSMCWAVYMDGKLCAVCSDKEQALDSVNRLAAVLCKTEQGEPVVENEITFEYGRWPDMLPAAEDYFAPTDICPAVADGFAAVSTQKYISEVTVPCALETLYDPQLFSFQSGLTRAGADGLIRQTHKCTYRNGTLVSDEITVEQTVTEMVTEQYTVGVKPGYTSGTFIWPCQGMISSPFGRRSAAVGSADHEGIDIAADRGTDVVASDGGKVVFAERYMGFGNYIIIYHENDIMTGYAHLDDILVEVGQHVNQGELIAHMGSTGLSSGPHLHFEVWVDRKKADPIPYLPQPE